MTLVRCHGSWLLVAPVVYMAANSPESFDTGTHDGGIDIHVDKVKAHTERLSLRSGMVTPRELDGNFLASAMAVCFAQRRQLDMHPITRVKSVDKLAWSVQRRRIAIFLQCPRYTCGGHKESHAGPAGQE